MLPICPICVTIRAVLWRSHHAIKELNHHKEQKMTKALNKARPVVEAIVVSVALVIVAIAVPAAIVYAAV